MLLTSLTGLPREWEDPEGGGALVWEVADMTGTTRWPEDSFDVVLDKAMLDALLTSRLRASGAASDSTGEVDATAPDRPAAPPALSGNVHSSSHASVVVAPEAGARMPPDTSALPHASDCEQIAGAETSAWSDTSDGDLTAARGYLAELHRLLASGA